MAEEEESTPQLLDAALRAANKSTYTTLDVILQGRQGALKREDSGGPTILLVVAVILSRGQEDSINTYVFPLAIRLTKGKKLAIGPLYHWSLYAQMDECANNIFCFKGLYNVATHVDTCFL